jgi:signal transduction histidine kinase
MADLKSQIPEALTFHISPRTMQMLGRENISSPRVAILELVKNAYDADASQVTVRFRRASTEDGYIVIGDDGEGMDFKELCDKWMVISTDNKLQEPWTRRGRVKVGEKGIGRLGLDRLSGRTTLITHRANADGLKLTIDWTRYEQEQGELQEIEHSLEVVPKKRGGHPGTTLRLTGLRDRWTYQDYEALYSDLSLLVPPFETELVDFKIIFDCDEASNLSGVITSPMAAIAEYRLVSELSADGEVHHTLTHRSGETVEDFRRWHEAFDGVAEGDRPACGPLRFTLYFYLREVSSLRGTGIKRAELLHFLDRFQGVRIYRDSFRVKPYGDPRSDKDWLGLNARRVQHPGGVGARIGEWRLAENQVVGSIFITRHDNPDLRDQTNREGLVENQAYYDLRRFVLHGVLYLEQKRQERYRREKGRKEPEIEVRPTLVTARQQLKEQAQQLRKTAGDLRGTFAEPKTPTLLTLAERTESLADQLEVAEETYSEEETERQLMLGLATLGIAMAAFGHETAQSINQVLGRAELLRPALDDLPAEKGKRAQQNLDALIKFAGRIEAWGQFALDRVSRDKRTQRNIDLNQTIETPLRAFEGMLTRRSIKTEIALADNLPFLRAFAMDIEATLINFITNAIAALDPTPLPDRHIFVSTAYDTELNAFQITFADSGRGIRDEDLNQIWDPLFSTKVDERGQPVGTGLGLTIVKNIVEEYSGSIEVDGHGRLGGAEFRVMLPHRYRQREENGHDE